MPITQITYQNGSESINAAYRPIVYKCRANNPNSTPEDYKPELVFCDIYIEGVYYKSLWKSSPIFDDGIAPEYEFDIQDAIQEILSYNLPPLSNRNILGFENTIKSVFVRFRNCYLQDGFITSEQLEPVQGTSNVEPTPGGGVQSNSIYVLNSNIHHEEPQNLPGLLSIYKYGDFATGVYPLTKRPKKYKLCRTDSSYFPIISNQRPTKICIRIHHDNGEIEEVCSEFLTDCPKLQNLNYSVQRNDGNQKFVFTWTLPDNWELTASVRIYYRVNGTTIWNDYVDVSIDSPAELILPLGKYDFRFEMNGACNNNTAIGSLPGFDNIGISSSENLPPEASIYWDDTHTTENRSCVLPTVCSQLMKVQSVSDPEGNLELYVWQKSTNNGMNWVNTSQANVNLISFEALTQGEYWFRVKAVDTDGLEGFSNILKYTVTTKSGGSPMITNVTRLPNACSDAGETFQITIEGQIDQEVNFNVLAIACEGHGATLKVFDNTTLIYTKTLITDGSTGDGSLNLGPTGVKQFIVQLCLRPCLNSNYSNCSVNFTLYNNDGVTLSDQVLFLAAYMDCDFLTE